MKSLTEQLIEASQGILNPQPEVRDEKGYYQMFDDGGVEVQTSEFLWGLVRLLQPEHILETGTYTGVSSLYIAQALKDNGHGHITTLEIEATHKNRAEKLWQNCGVSEYVSCLLKPSLDFRAEVVYDFLFLDSEPQLRFAELIKFFPSLKPGGFIGIHDLAGHLGQEDIINPDHAEFKFWPWGELPEQIKAWIKTDQLRVITLPAPRGMVLLYKTKESDYAVQ